MRNAIERDTAFLHRLQQRGLRLWRGAVDFVGQQQFAENGSAGQRELARLEIEQVRSQDVAGQQVGGKLDAPEIEAKAGGKALCQQRLGRARRPFKQDVPA